MAFIITLRVAACVPRDATATPILRRSTARPSLAISQLPTGQQTMGTATTLTNGTSETSAEPKRRTFGVPQLIAAMLKSGGHVSDLIFSPGRAPQVEVSGKLVEIKFKGLECLAAEDTRVSRTLP